TLIVLWWTSKPMYFTLSMGVPFVRCSYCCSQQLQPTPKGAPFYIAWPCFPAGDTQPAQKRAKHDPSEQSAITETGDPFVIR
ncbi:MAG TPA: hypothetical protein VFO46_14930, partial [Candidatus Sulfotelmatobacter sp.]|nr:hypothetical protein [Candidatus Sulfotelmatobacter sp.]